MVNFRKKANQEMRTPKDDSPLYIAEVLLNCSSDSIKNAVTEAAKPPSEGEKGEMVVSGIANSRDASFPVLAGILVFSTGIRNFRIFKIKKKPKINKKKTHFFGGVKVFKMSPVG